MRVPSLDVDIADLRDVISLAEGSSLDATLVEDAKAKLQRASSEQSGADARRANAAKELGRLTSLPPLSVDTSELKRAMAEAHTAGAPAALGAVGQMRLRVALRSQLERDAAAARLKDASHAAERSQVGAAVAAAAAAAAAAGTKGTSTAATQAARAAAGAGRGGAIASVAVVEARPVGGEIDSLVLVDAEELAAAIEQVEA